MEISSKTAIIAILVVIPIMILVTIWIDTPPSNDTEAVQEITVMASFYPLYDFTKSIGGDKINVELLVSDGIEPHDWDPSIRDIEKMQKAQLIVINGIGFENWVDKFSQIASDTKIIDASDTITPLGNDTKDPHIWLNPVLVKNMVENISDALQQLDPNNAVFYQSNTKIYLDKLDTLDNKIETELLLCDRDFITYHNAFSYFAKEYGLRQHTIIQSNDPHAEPTPQTFQNVIELAKQLQINVIFTEEGIDQRTLEIVSNEIDGKLLVLSPIEIGQENSDYIQRMEKNLSNLKEALC